MFILLLFFSLFSILFPKYFFNFDFNKVNDFESFVAKKLQFVLKLLNNKGIILAVCYPHEEGKKESKTILNYLNKNDIYYIICDKGEVNSLIYIINATITPNVI